ncbi:DUF6046 domain-containing protein [Flavobacterium geliluteum]|uniref:DUF6046 domain-containing protein n=1 Tax=Flavobacterium geliluteum TaxID=2816120 RepID=A0A940XCA0_9FLAO|nr:DUF6046 domain-containing protein [Flavobacterium geliluteum]MBP4140017.1 hypothetical protein [Flavobacterium geliluteum]
MENKEILFASLVGSKVVEQIPRFSAIQNELAKHVLPPIPFLPLRNQDKIKKASVLGFEDSWWLKDSAPKEDQQFFPLSFSLTPNGQKYLLPYETMISINGKNQVVKRSVAKGNKIPGKIKERWSQDDYDITITGVLLGDYEIGTVENCYPISDFRKLKSFLTAPQAVYVFCEPLQLLGINKIVIEDFSFPFTKGENVQAYEIKAVSDFDYALILKLNEV